MHLFCLLADCHAGHTHRPPDWNQNVATGSQISSTWKGQFLEVSNACTVGSISPGTFFLQKLHRDHTIWVVLKNGTSNVQYGGYTRYRHIPPATFELVPKPKGGHPESKIFKKIAAVNLKKKNC